MRAAELGANTFQVFSASPRMWRAGRPDPVDIKKLKAARERFDLAPLVIHDNYLINLAAGEMQIREQSIEAFHGEAERALAIGAEYLVMHPGSYGDQGLERGICTLIESMRAAGNGLRVRGLTILVENTVGGGARLGGSFEELRVIGELARKFLDAPLGFCLDAAHCLAAGYVIADREGLRRMVREADAAIGLENVKLIHANDSKTPLGSRLDRHEHIGRGFIGEEGFRGILTHPKLRTKPFILETPHDHRDDARRNLEMLKRLCRKRTTTTRESN